MERRLVSVQRWTCNSFCRGTYGRISEFSPGSARGPLGKGGSFSAGRLSSQIELLLRVLHLPPSLAYSGLVLNHGRGIRQEPPNFCSLGGRKFLRVFLSDL